MLDPDCLLLKQMLFGTETPNIFSDLLPSLTLSLHSGREILEEFEGSRIPAAEFHVPLCLAVSSKALIWSFSSFPFTVSELRPSVEADGSDELQGQTDKFKTGSHRITNLKKQDDNSLKAGFGMLHSLPSCSYCRQCQGCISISGKLTTFRWEPILRTGWVLAD